MRHAILFLMVLATGSGCESVNQVFGEFHGQDSEADLMDDEAERNDSEIEHPANDSADTPTATESADTGDDTNPMDTGAGESIPTDQDTASAPKTDTLTSGRDGPDSEDDAIGTETGDATDTEEFIENETESDPSSNDTALNDTALNDSSCETSSDADADTDSETFGNADAGVDTNTVSDTETGSDTGVETELETTTDVVTDVDMDTGLDSETESDAEMDSSTGLDTERDTGTDADTVDGSDPCPFTPVAWNFDSDAEDFVNSTDTLAPWIWEGGAMTLDAVFPPAPGDDGYAQISHLIDFDMTCATALDVLFRTIAATAGEAHLYVLSGAPDWYWHDFDFALPTDTTWSTFTLDLVAPPPALDLSNIRDLGIQIKVTNNDEEEIVQVEIDSFVLR